MKPMVLVCLCFLAIFTNAQLSSTSDSSSPQLYDIQSIWPGAHFMVDEQSQYQVQDIIDRPPFNSSISSSFDLIIGQVWI